MRRTLRTVLASLAVPLLPLLAFPLACEQRFSANPPVQPLPAGSGVDINALLAPSADAQAVAMSVSHAIVVVRCPGGPGCPATSASGEGSEPSYRVAFGDGSPTSRSRGQAMADLYKELRDRLSAKEHLDVRPVAGPDGGAGVLTLPRVDPKSDDPPSIAAARILDAAEVMGGISVDLVPAYAGAGCRISIQGGTPDKGSGCLLAEPEGVKRLGH